MPVIEDLIVSDYGAFIGQKGRRLRVSVPDQAVVDAPIMHLRSVRILTRSATVSSSAIAACCEAGIPLHFIDPVGGCYASILSPQLTTVVTNRRCQIMAAETLTGVKIIRAIAAGKIQSQIRTLRYLVRRIEDHAICEHIHLTSLDLEDCIAKIETLGGESIHHIRHELMGHEGYASKLYWTAIAQFIPDIYNWTGRTGRHATDPINCLLNYGYGILYSEVQNALVIAGLEPYAGLLHTDRPGKPALTLDFIEEFRSPIVDRTVIGLARRGFNVEIDDSGRISRDTRKAFAEHVLSRLNAQGKYGHKRYQLRSIIQMQARRLASAFREDERYEAYKGN